VDEGILQAYYDGELSSEMMQRVGLHLAACAQCAEEARAIEAETAAFAEAFAPEMALSVPTERLRLRLDAAIAELQPPQQERAALAGPKDSSRLRSWLSGLMAPFSFVPQQQAIGFASLIAVAAFGLIFAYLILRPGPATLDVASGVKTTELRSFEAEKNTGDGAGQTQAPSIVKASNSSATRGGAGFERRRTSGAGRNRPAGGTVIEPHKAATELTAALRLLPGEKSYLKAIASLDTAIKASGDNGLRPTLRAEYERNLQVVDEAIAQTRVVARHNPNDKDAAEFLFSAYQSKVELMNTVAEQAQLSTDYR
jgi:hypothetical protein